MRLLVNRVRVSRRFSTFGIFVKHLARNLFSLALGISTGYFFVTLVLQPVSAYAAPAMVAGAAGSMASAPRIEREASFGHAGSAAMVAGLRLDSPIAGDRLVPNDGPAVRIPGNVLDALRQATLESPGKSTADEAKPLAITIVLKRSDPKGFKRYLHDVYDSRSPAFHRFLTPRQVSDRFGPSREAYGSVLHYLESGGLKLAHGSTDRMTLTVRGTRMQVERVFGVAIANYRIANRIFYANDRDPALPKPLAVSVEAVTGLSNLATAQASQGWEEGLAVLFFVALILTFLYFILKNLIQQGIDAIKKWNFGQGTAAGAGGAGTGSGTSVAFDSTAHPFGANLGDDPQAAVCTPWSGVNGSGQIVGLVEFDTFNPSDVADYLNTIGKPASLLANVTEVPVNGGVATPGANQSEVLLDIDEILTLAPGAKIVVYDAPFTGPGAAFQPIINQMIDDGVTIIANTWNYCEDQTSSADVFSIDSLFQTAAASGITVFNATGDAGSTCKDGSANTVAVPADSPNAVAVGGTTLTSGPGFTYGSETWWNGTTDSPPSGQGGFGVSKFFARPPYQDAFVLGASRSVPDVADSANPNNGFAICQANAGGCPAFLKGGTSAATMAWAAFQALVNQSVGHNLGFVNPAYYSFADTDGFHNAASMGSDFPHVGLGSPNLPNLHLQLCGQKPGPADSTDSQVLALAPGGTVLKASIGVAADGTKAGMQAVLVDANGNSVSGKTVALSANAGSHVTITPPSAVSNIANGVANFSVSDKTVETVTFTATDKTDGVVLKQTPQLAFIGPPATGAGLDAFPATRHG